MPVTIPFNRPSVEGRELELMAESVANGQISGDGPFTRKATGILEEIFPGAKVLLTTSCTDALEMSAILNDVAPGDEVIVPAFTFVSGVNAFVLRGAKPVFADVRPDTFNIAEDAVASLVSSRTRVIAPVHYAGVGCDMEAILAIAARYGISVVEDNAHGIFARWKSKPLGTFAPLATQSFHETKNINCGEGGALIINDRKFIDRAEVIREKGTNRSRFFRGLIDKYTWVDIGSSYLPSDLLAAYLVGQLEARHRIQVKRKNIWMRYEDGLLPWAKQNGARLPYVPAEAEQPYHMFYVVLPSLTDREALRAHLLQHGIVAAFHYVALNTSPMGARFGAQKGECPVAEDVSDRLLRLPFYNDLSMHDEDRVIDSILSWRS